MIARDCSRVCRQRALHDAEIEWPPTRQTLVGTRSESSELNGNTVTSARRSLPIPDTRQRPNRRPRRSPVTKTTGSTMPQMVVGMTLVSTSAKTADVPAWQYDRTTALCETPDPPVQTASKTCRQIGSFLVFESSHQEERPRHQRLPERRCCKCSPSRVKRSHLVPEWRSWCLATRCSSRDSIGQGSTKDRIDTARSPRRTQVLVTGGPKRQPVPDFW